MSQKLQTKKIPLDPQQDNEIIRLLKLSAIVYRRKLLDLGRDLKIRLHYGATMSSAEILTFLYLRWLIIDPKRPDWKDRDRFVLSKGHAAPGLYVALWMSGYFEESAFDDFRRLGSSLQGHPDRNKTPGVDCTTGSLGQGFPVSCGMAIGAMIDHASYRIYSLISDGECNEGSTWEAALIAANNKINCLTVLLDWNKKSSYGLMAGRNDIEPLADKWLSFGWHVIECDGHDFVSLSNALFNAEQISDKPTIILCNTVKGKGIPYAENYPTSSNFGLTEDQYQEAIASLEFEKEKLGS